MHPRIRNLAQPGPDPRVGGIAIDLEPVRAKLARQRNVKAPAQVADEAFDLAVGASGRMQTASGKRSELGFG